MKLAAGDEHLVAGGFKFSAGADAVRAQAQHDRGRFADNAIQPAQQAFSVKPGA